MTPVRLADITGSQAEYDPEELRVEQAQQIIRAFVEPVRAVEKLALRHALGRVLAEDVISPINVPAHDNSAMDGYALRAADLAHSTVRLRIVGTAYAGDEINRVVALGECMRIMTGAPMPAGCDTVIPQELTGPATQTELAVPPGLVKAGDNRRLKGEDLRAGCAALPRGKVLRPADLGLLASLGIAEVPVMRRLKVAIFSTGNELRSIGETLDPGCVYDSNRYTLHGMLTRLGCDILDMGVVKDDAQALEVAFRSACDNADVVITSGGVSAGEADHTRKIMARLGEVAFWKMAVRPGRPMAFGKIASNGKCAYLFALPGNPVAVMVSFYFFVRDALLHMMGAQDRALPLMQATAYAAIRKKPGRTEYQRAIVSRDPDGKCRVRLTGAQGSGILRSMSEANCIVVLHHDQGSVNAGETVDILLFEGLI